MVVAYLKTTDWHTYTYINKLSAHDSDFQWLDYCSDLHTQWTILLYTSEHNDSKTL